MAVESRINGNRNISQRWVRLHASQSFRLTILAHDIMPTLDAPDKDRYTHARIYIPMGMRKKLRNVWKADRKVQLSKQRKQKAKRLAKKA